MKQGYHKAGVPVARYIIPSTYELGLEFNPLTTQIESHDIICVIFNYIKINPDI